MDCILSIDQGTTGTTALLINRNLDVIARASKEFPQYFPSVGWVEHNPYEIWESVCFVVKKVQQDCPFAVIKSIGITNQRETCLLWDRKTSKPLSNAIVWQCKRTKDLCEKLRSDGLSEEIKEKTGLVLDPYFSASKVSWMLDNIPHARQEMENNNILFGTIDTYLLWCLTGGAVHVTDVSNASRTLLMNLKTLSWDDSLLEIFSISKNLLPKIASSSEIYGYSSTEILPNGIPISGIAGDQQAALFGQLCLKAGSAKCTYGTGAFLLMNTGDAPIYSKNGLLTTVAWKIGENVTYALEGSAFIAGAAVQWLRDGLKLIKTASEIEELAKTVQTSEGVIFVPALSGLGAPYWRPNAKGCLLGITRGTTFAHIARAVLDGIALQNYDILTAMEQDLGEKLFELKVDGGAAINSILMQYQADILGVKIIRPKMLETTALGAALLSGLSIGFWNGFDELEKVWQLDSTYSPSMDDVSVKEIINNWHSAVSKA